MERKIFISVLCIVLLFSVLFVAFYFIDKNNTSELEYDGVKITFTYPAFIPHSWESKDNESICYFGFPQQIMAQNTYSYGVAFDYKLNLGSRLCYVKIHSAKVSGEFVNKFISKKFDITMDSVVVPAYKIEIENCKKDNSMPKMTVVDFVNTVSQRTKTPVVFDGDIADEVINISSDAILSKDIEKLAELLKNESNIQLYTADSIKGTKIIYKID